MSDPTSTSTSTDQTNPLAAFGAVETSTITTTLRTPMTDAEIAGFDYAATYFAARTNRHVMSLNFPDVAAAKRFRAMATLYAEINGLSVGFPKASDDNDLPETWNTDANVTFRFAIRREVTEAKRSNQAAAAKPAARKNRRTR